MTDDLNHIARLCVDLINAPTALTPPPLPTWALMERFAALYAEEGGGDIYRDVARGARFFAEMLGNGKEGGDFSGPVAVIDRINEARSAGKLLETFFDYARQLTMPYGGLNKAQRAPGQLRGLLSKISGKPVEIFLVKEFAEEVAGAVHQAIEIEFGPGYPENARKLVDFSFNPPSALGRQ